jgi:hypothetical protein
MTSSEAFVSSSPSTPWLARWPLSRRLAFEVRFAAALALDKGVPGANERSQSVVENNILKPIRAKADHACASDMPTHEWLRALIAEMRAMRLDDAGTSEPLVRSRVMVFCSLLERTLEAVSADPIPSDVASLFQALNHHIAGRYRDFCAAPFVQPEIYLETGHRDADPRNDGLAVDGSCRVEDQPGGPISIVKMIVRDGCFDWNSICQMPYVFVHELLCHAYQSISSAGLEEQRADVEKDCAWTEGWMDHLAVLATEEWIKTQARLPLWVTEAKEDIRTATRAASDLRYRCCNNLKPGERSRRRAARSAVGQLKEEFSRVSEAPARDKLGEERLFTFSLTLNALRLPQPNRERIVELLGNALLIAAAADSDELSNIIGTFCRRCDWRWLERQLLRFCERP